MSEYSDWSYADLWYKSSAIAVANTNIDIYTLDQEEKGYIDRFGIEFNVGAGMTAELGIYRNEVFYKYASFDTFTNTIAQCESIGIYLRPNDIIRIKVKGGSGAQVMQTYMQYASQRRVKGT